MVHIFVRENLNNDDEREREKNYEKYRYVLCCTTVV